MTERPVATQRLPLFDHADQACHAARAVRRRRRRRHLRFATVAIGIALIGATIAVPPQPRLVWNASASAPLGLYGITPGAALVRGDMVIAWAPSAPRRLAATRHYLSINVPLVKRVRAVAGDRVCAIGSAITVDGRRIATRLPYDAAGRAMP